MAFAMGAIRALTEVVKASKGSQPNPTQPTKLVSLADVGGSLTLPLITRKLQLRP